MENESGLSEISEKPKTTKGRNKKEPKTTKKSNRKGGGELKKNDEDMDMIDGGDLEFIIGQNLPIEHFDETDFTIRNDKRRPLQNDSTVPLAKVFKKNGIEHVPFYRFSDDIGLKRELDQYPSKTDSKCCTCGLTFDTAPIYPPLSFDKMRNIYLLDVFPTCSTTCAKGYILAKKRSNMAEQLAILSRFLRDYFGVEGPITFMPLSVMKSYNSNGWMTDQEYIQKAGRISSFIKQPPCLFVETWVEENEILYAKEQKSKSHLSNARATDEQRENYRVNQERVIQEYKAKKSSVPTTKVMKKMFGVKG